MNYRMFGLLSTLVFFIVSIARADVAPPSSADNSQLPACNAPGIQPPTAANSHAANSDDYPRLSLILGEQGDTILGLIIHEDGSVSDIKVEKTSGSSTLDGAAISTVAPRWKYNPATKDGKSIACLWKAAVVWRFSVPNQILPAIVVVGADHYTPEMRELKESGAVAIVVSVGPDGKVQRATVTRSSGFSDIDQASLHMASSGWQFKPAEANGTPIPAVIGLAFIWGLAPRSFPAEMPQLAPPPK